jgi:regulator of sigma E protease
MTAVVAIVALCLVIMLHEAGHYAAAVATGMKVDRFSVFGIGPPIVRFGTWRGTEFVISAIPFGAYVQIRGMEPGDPDEPQTERTTQEVAESPNFRDKPLLSRVIVILGGPVANYISAMVLLLFVYASAGMPGPVVAIEVAGVHADSAAQAAGIEPGDQLVAVGDTTIDPSQRGRDVAAATRQYLGSDVELVVQRGDAQQRLTASLPAESSAPLGVDLRAVAPREPVALGTAASHAFTDPLRDTAIQLQGLWMLITGQLEASVQGPVGMVQTIAKAADAGIVPFLLMTAFISTLLGMFNLLPLPALDGGRLMFLFVEGIRRRRASARIEEMVHGYGMLALLALIALVTIGDVRRLL